MLKLRRTVLGKVKGGKAERAGWLCQGLGLSGHGHCESCAQPRSGRTLTGPHAGPSPSPAQRLPPSAHPQKARDFTVHTFNGENPGPEPGAREMERTALGAQLSQSGCVQTAPLGGIQADALRGSTSS